MIHYSEQLKYVIIGFITMPISISNLAQVLVFKVKMTAGKHKKKLIFALVVLLVGYVAKKKLTLGHVLSFVEGVTRLIQALPLPEAPRMRQLAEYEHPNTVPLKGILEATGLEEIKRRIGRKQAGWQDLKRAITTSLVVTLTLFNSNSLCFLIQNKYREEFMSMEASTQFEQAMYTLRKRFTDQIPLLFENVGKMISWELEKMELTKVYDIEQLIVIFSNMVGKIFEGKFDVSKERGFSRVDRVSKQTRNYFMSTYQYIPEKKSFWSGAGRGILRCMGGFLSINELFPQARVEVTSERYIFTKMAYLQPLKKASNELQDFNGGFSWPNKQSKELFALLIEEMEFIITSVNFSTLLREYSKYNLKILYNRLVLLLLSKQKMVSGIKMSELLPSLYKIIQEQFLRANQGELRDKYHSLELKKALKVVVQSQNLEVVEEEGRGEGKMMEEDVLEEIELKQSFQFLEKQLELKIYNERSGFVMHPKSSSGDREAEEMKKLLGMVSSNNMFGAE